MTHAPDPAASHARSLLDSLDLPLPIPARPDPESPALAWARSGAMALSGATDGPPRFACGPVASAADGTGRALAALFPARGFESLDAPALLGERAALFGFTRGGSTSCGGSARLLPTSDGVLAVNLPRAADWRMIAAWLEADLPGIESTRDWSALARALTDRPCDPLVLRGREIGLAVARAGPVPATPPAPFRLEFASRTSAPRDRAEGRPARVLDLSSLWAGPLASSLLAQAGFEVVKVENPARPDGARQGEPRFFDLLNADKHPCALDLTTPRDRADFEALLAGADIVLESARARALAQLGIDARAWVAAQPGRLWASITGYGREREWIAFGDDAAVAAGLAFDPEQDPDRNPATHPEPGSRPGPGRDAVPRFCGDAIADPLTGMTAAVAIGALHAQGRGGLLSLGLVEVAAHAAASSAFPLTLALECRAGTWSVHDGGPWIAVAPPRARAPRGSAPGLQPPDAALLERWTRAC